LKATSTALSMAEPPATINSVPLNNEAVPVKVLVPLSFTWPVVTCPGIIVTPPLPDIGPLNSAMPVSAEIDNPPPILVVMALSTLVAALEYR
jgi:hypothetical protein